MPAADVDIGADMVRIYNIFEPDNSTIQNGMLVSEVRPAARAGDTIGIFAQPRDWSQYAAVHWIVMWKDENNVSHDLALTPDPNDHLRATFVMPAGDVYIPNKCVETALPECRNSMKAWDEISALYIMYKGNHKGKQSRRSPKPMAISLKNGEKQRINLEIRRFQG